MHCTNRIIAGALVCLAASANAHATVVYNWHNTTSGTRVSAVAGTLRVDDAHYRAGAVDFDTRAVSGNPDGSLDSPLSESGLILNYNYTLPNDETATSGPIPVFVDPTRPGFDDSNFGNALVAALIFNDDGTLSGRFDVATPGDRFSSHGAGRSWTVTDVASDFFEDGCNIDPACTGGTGFWLLDESTRPETVTVPTAGIWSLYALAVSAMFGAFRFGARGPRPART
ncbi:hypothetical protein [Salinisphaera orenii]|uniref:hypothetical protein n=1 Tax=Salinisphaera orenii TaxID=856731 RepID=UPI000F4B2D04|nr:hypothetical protein [Salinisphaera orenii]